MARRRAKPAAKKRAKRGGAGGDVRGPGRPSQDGEPVHTPSSPRSRFAKLKFFDPTTARRVEKASPTPEEASAAIVNRLAGVESAAECGCKGTWQLRGETVWWTPGTLCSTHAHLQWKHPIQFPPLKAPPPELVTAIRAAGWNTEIWPLPCKLCGATDHKRHGPMCVFWAVNECTPF